EVQMPAPTSSSSSSGINIGNDLNVPGADKLGTPDSFLAAHHDIWGLILGSKWGGAVGEGIALTFSFPAAGATWYERWYEPGYETDPANFHPFSYFTGAVAAATAALDAYSHVANISFTLVSDTASDVGDIRFGVTEMDQFDPGLAGTYAYAYSPGGPVG